MLAPVDRIGCRWRRSNLTRESLKRIFINFYSTGKSDERWKMIFLSEIEYALFMEKAWIGDEKSKRRLFETRPFLPVHRSPELQTFAALANSSFTGKFELKTFCSPFYLFPDFFSSPFSLDTIKPLLQFILFSSFSLRMKSLWGAANEIIIQLFSLRAPNTKKFTSSLFIRFALASRPSLTRK